MIFRMPRRSTEAVYQNEEPLVSDAFSGRVTAAMSLERFARAGLVVRVQSTLFDEVVLFADAPCS